MANISVRNRVKEQATARAAASGYGSVDAYVEALIEAEAAGAPEGLTIDSDEALQALLSSRMNGPWVDVDEEDFARIRAKFQAQLDAEEGQP